MSDTPLQQTQRRLIFKTRGPGFTDISADVTGWLEANRCMDGLLTVFIRHTSASLAIQENADPAVLADLAAALDRTAPRDLNYKHRTEGPDDMPAHIRSMLTSTSLSIPVAGGQMLLGTWQGLYLIEHRDAPHNREIVVHFIGNEMT